MEVTRSERLPKRSFSRVRCIQYSDCDTAGIVFFPRYFLMISDLVERWFHEHLDLSYKDLKENHKIAVCTSEITAQFLSAARYGEKIRLSLTYKFIENYQICLSIEGTVARIKKFKAEVLVRFSDFETEAPVNVPTIISKRLNLVSTSES